MSTDQAAKESASNENMAEIDQFESELAGKMLTAWVWLSALRARLF
jgi:hypothetical protein